jgi:hypothetical protein
VTRRRGRRKKLLYDLGDRRGYSRLKEEVLDRIKWRNRFGRGCGAVIWQITDEWWIVTKCLFSSDTPFRMKNVTHHNAWSSNTWKERRKTIHVRWRRFQWRHWACENTNKCIFLHTQSLFLEVKVQLGVTQIRVPYLISSALHLSKMAPSTLEGILPSRPLSTSNAASLYVPPQISHLCKLTFLRNVWYSEYRHANSEHTEALLSNHFTSTDTLKFVTPCEKNNNKLNEMWLCKKSG